MSMNMPGMGGTTTTTTTTTPVITTQVTSAQVEQYIESLSLTAGSADYDLFNRLLLIDAGYFQQLVSGLVNNVITLDQIRNLSSIDNTTVEHFLYQVSTGVQDAVSIRQQYIDILDSQFQFSAMKASVLPSFNTYVYNKYRSNSDFYTAVTIDSVGITSGTYTSFYAAEQAYLAVVGFRPLSSVEVSQGVDFHLYDPELETRYRSFLDYHNSFAYKIPMIKSLVDMSMQKGVFLLSEFNQYPFLNYPSYVSLLKSLHRQFSPSTFNQVYSELLSSMVLESSQDSFGWMAVNDRISTMKWSDMTTKFGLMDDFLDYFYRLQLIRYYYPNMYGSYNTSVDVMAEKMVIDQFMQYFDLASSVLNDVVSKVKSNMA